MISLKSGVFQLNKIDIKNYMNAMMCINSYQNLSCDQIKDFSSLISERISQQVTF